MGGWFNNVGKSIGSVLPNPAKDPKGALDWVPLVGTGTRLASATVNAANGHYAESKKDGLAGIQNLGFDAMTVATMGTSLGPSTAARAGAKAVAKSATQKTFEKVAFRGGAATMVAGAGADMYNSYSSAKEHHLKAEGYGAEQPPILEPVVTAEKPHMFAPHMFVGPALIALGVYNLPNSGFILAATTFVGVFVVELILTDE